MFKIGIDLGGTKIEGIVLDEENREVIRRRIGTEQEKGAEHILNNIASLYHNLAGKISYAAHTLGLGTPGSISSRTGLLKNSNTVCLNGTPLKENLEKKLDHPIGLQNDANCFALAEARMGAGVGKEMVFGAIMGTGCGGGIVWNGKVREGLQSIAGEWGHTSIDPNGPECYCGKKGCVETFISGGGLEKAYLKKNGIAKMLPDIIADFRQGEACAGEIMDEFFDRFGVAMSNLINTLDPDVVVIGGGVSNFEEIYSRGVEKVRQYIFNDELLTPIVKNHLGDSAGVFGAAFIGI